MTAHCSLPLIFLDCEHSTVVSILPSALLLLLLFEIDIQLLLLFFESN